MLRDERAPSFLVIGQVVGARGVRGEMKVRVETEAPERFLSLRVVHLGGHRAQFAVERARLFQGQALLQLAGIATREAVEGWVGALVQVPIAQALPLESEQYYYHQIEGLRVVTVDGEELGHVKEVLPTGANDVYVVASDREEILLPAIKDVIVRIDLEQGLMVVRLLDGLRA